MSGLPREALDRRGYIINQDMTGPIPFGRKGSVACGCGWIAAYNLRHWQGSPAEPGQVARVIHRLSPLSGLFGVNVLALWLYLLVLGYWPVLLPVTRRTKHRGTAGILMYKVRWGGHYVAYLPAEDGNYLFLNGIYGKRDHVAALGEFVQQRSRWPLALTLAVRRPKR